MRINLFALALAASAGLAAVAPAAAQNYPDRPITFMVPAPPGGATDAIARGLADELGRRLHQTIIIDNRGGASGMLGTQLAARAKPDGYTLLVAHAVPIFYVPHMFAKVPYDVSRDLAPISELCDSGLVFAVPTSVPATTMKEFVAWAGKNKGKVNYGSYGIGSPSHLLSAYLSDTHGLQMNHVSYKGEAPMIQAMYGGQLHAAIGTVGTAGPHIASGRLRPLAVIGEQRLADLPNVPTMAEAGFPDAEYKPQAGIVLMAPAGTPPAVLQLLEKETRAAVQTAPMKALFRTYGMQALGNSSADFRQRMEASGPVIQRMIRISGAKVE